MAQQEGGFHVPNSTIALMLVLTIVFMAWSFAVISTSLSTPNAAPVTGVSQGPSYGSLGFFFGERPNPNNPIQTGQAKLTVVDISEGEAAQ